MRFSALLTTVVSLVVCSLAGRAFGQLESKTALAYAKGPAQSNVIACFALKVQVTESNTLALYKSSLQTGTYDLVILEIGNPFYYIPAAEKPVLIGLFEDHLAKGGALLVNYPDLDSWPQLAELCGAVVTKDRGQNQGSVGPATPYHPAWLFSVVSVFPNQTLWPDHGDDLEPALTSEVVAIWDDSLAACAVSHADEKRIVNGFDWDQYDSGPALTRAQLNIRYLIGCRADLDFSGQLTVNDFFEFQNLFSNKHPFANMCFDEFFDVFDFLEFFNKFIGGCD